MEMEMDMMVSDIEVREEENHYSIEWDGIYGKYWQCFSSKEEFEARLEEYRIECEEWPKEQARRESIERAERNKEMIAKGKKARALREMRTLGGMFPVLAQLRNELRGRSFARAV